MRSLSLPIYQGENVEINMSKPNNFKIEKVVSTHTRFSLCKDNNGMIIRLNSRNDYRKTFMVPQSPSNIIKDTIKLFEDYITLVPLKIPPSKFSIM